VPDYLLDSGFYITARVGPYGFDIAPGFWDTLDEHIATGVIASPESVYQELVAGGDSDLAQWVRDRKDSGLFLPVPSEAVQRHYRTVSAHVFRTYDSATAQTFLDGADGWLVAHALDCKATVVTCETENRPGKARAKIPDVCKHFGISCIGMVRLLRLLKFRLTK
jgi:hypothetical protein